MVGADPSFPNEGWLTIQGLAQPAQFNVGVATEEDTGHMVVGLKPADVGAVTVSGPLARLAVGGDIDVGEYGTGTLSASDGATITSYGGYLGYRPGSLGTVTLQGSGTSWQLQNDFCVGYQGTGALSLSQGARLLGNPSGESGFYVGSEAGSNGQVELTDPGTQLQFYEGTLVVGSAGTGAMLIQNQAAAYSGYGYIGDEAGSQGAVQIVGAGSLWQLSNSLWVGVSGQGALAVRDGASVACRYLTVAGFDGSAGALLVSGPQSTVNVQQDVFIGGWMQSDDDVPTRNDWVNGGTAAVLVENGGRLAAGGTVWIGGRSAVRLTGGTLEAENLDIMSGGVLSFTGGALAIRRQISVDGTLETDGTLPIGNGMSLVGNGLICAPETQLLAGSLLAPGHSIGTLSFAGNVSLGSGSRFEVELADAGQCDRIVVSDTLQLGGTLALKKTTPGGPSWGYLFASAGQIEGAFDAIDTSALGVTPKRIVQSSQWGLLLKFKDFADLATTQNARNAAAPLDAAIDAGQSNWLTDRLVDHRQRPGHQPGPRPDAGRVVRLALEPWHPEHHERLPRAERPAAAGRRELLRRHVRRPALQRRVHTGRRAHWPTFARVPAAATPARRSSIPPGAAGPSAMAWAARPPATETPTAPITRPAERSWPSSGRWISTPGSASSTATAAFTSPRKPSTSGPRWTTTRPARSSSAKWTTTTGCWPAASATTPTWRGGPSPSTRSKPWPWATTAAGSRPRTSSAATPSTASNGTCNPTGRSSTSISGKRRSPSRAPTGWTSTWAAPN